MLCQIKTEQGQKVTGPEQEKAKVAVNKIFALKKYNLHK